MNRENLYSIKIELPKKEKEYLGQVTKKISETINVGQPENDFHLMVEQALYCPDRSIRVDLDKWLEMQNPFKLTLTEISYFKYQKGGLIYLTTANKNERDEANDFHYNIHELIKSSDSRRQNNYYYVPHVTLLRGVPLSRVGEIKEKFLEEFNPIKIDVSEIIVTKKYGGSRWENVGGFRLRGNFGFCY